MPSTSTHLPLVPHVWSIVSGNGLLPDRHQAISPVPKPLLTYTLLILLLLWSCYLIDLFITVHKIWIEFELKANELNWNRIERFWIRFELERNLIEKSWIQLELELNWKKWIDPSPGGSNWVMVLWSAGGWPNTRTRLRWCLCSTVCGPPRVIPQQVGDPHDHIENRRRLCTWMTGVLLAPGHRVKG